MEYNALDLTVAPIVLFFSLAILLFSVIYAFYVKDPSIRRDFLKAIVISIIVVLSTIIVLPLFHQNDNCEVFYHCDAEKICPAIFSERKPCFLPVDVIPSILLIIPLMFVIRGLMKCKRVHHKFWLFFIVLLVSLGLAVLLYYGLTLLIV